MLYKKSLGQHFLRDPRILKKIADVAGLSPADTVVEVGPGEGTLTEVLLAAAGNVIAVEKDDRLIPILSEKFAAEIASGKLKLMHADVLEFSIFNFQFSKSPYKIVANLPYYITGQFFRKFLEETDTPPESMTLLLQKEVAERIVARDKKESILSVSIKAYGVPKLMGTVKAGAFSPPPKVDSAILTIERISKDFFATDGHLHAQHDDAHLVRMNEHRFFGTVRRGFAHPRKFVASNLGLRPAELQSVGIDEKARAESLSLEDWKRIICRTDLAPNTREARR